MSRIPGWANIIDLSTRKKKKKKKGGVTKKSKNPVPLFRRFEA